MSTRTTANTKRACNFLTYPEPLLVPQLVITEVCYLIETRLGWKAEVRFLGDLSSGNFTTAPVLPGIGCVSRSS